MTSKLARFASDFAQNLSIFSKINSISPKSFDLVAVRPHDVARPRGSWTIRNPNFSAVLSLPLRPSIGTHCAVCARRITGAMIHNPPRCLRGGLCAGAVAMTVACLPTVVLTCRGPRPAEADPG